MPLTLTRRPRTRRMFDVVRAELRDAYNQLLYPAVVRKYDEVADLKKWKNVPSFEMSVSMSDTLIQVEFALKDDMGSKIFGWVDEGTAGEGDPAITYPIDVVNAEALVFEVPYHPMTLPPSGLNYDPTAETRTIYTLHVEHPGIKPREFTKEVKRWLKDRSNTKGFYRVTENAVRRGYTKARHAGLA